MRQLPTRVGVRLDRSPLTAGDRVRIGWELEDSKVVVGEPAVAAPS